MQNIFIRHEQDFRTWVAGGYSPCEQSTLRFLQHLANPDDETRPRDGGLWPHQWDALLRVIYAREVAGAPLWQPGLLLNVVTGGGKTALIAAVMAWLQLSHGVARYLILCPNLIVRDRLEDDFRNGKVFRERGLLPPGSPLREDDFALTTIGGNVKASTANLFGGRVILGNIHQFHQSSETGQENLRQFLEMNETPFAIFNDEAHNTPATEYDASLALLQDHPAFRFRLDTTATPDRADDRPIDSNMIYEYEIPDALSDRVIASPYVYQPEVDAIELTYSDPDTGATRSVMEMDWSDVHRASVSGTQWVTDPEPMRHQIAIARQRLHEAQQRANGRYKPIMFVVAVSIADAKAAKRMLEEEFNFRTLIVTQESDEDARIDAAEIGRSEKYDAVVSVAMLREGWDVPEVSVILLLRKFGSRVYGPQVIGRGLRRVRKDDISSEEPQICAIVDHPKLDHQWLWDLLRAHVERDVQPGDTFDPSENLPEPEPKCEIVNPELLIELPTVVEQESAKQIELSVDAAVPANKNWRIELDSLSYETSALEITRVVISGVHETPLVAGEFSTTKGPPSLSDGILLVSLTGAELTERLRSRLRYIAELSLDDVGLARANLQSVYRALVKHVERRFLDGANLRDAPDSHKHRAYAMVPQLEEHLARRHDIVRGIVEHPDA